MARWDYIFIEGRRESDYKSTIRKIRITLRDLTYFDLPYSATEGLAGMIVDGIKLAEVENKLDAKG